MSVSHFRHDLNQNKLFFFRFFDAKNALLLILSYLFDSECYTLHQRYIDDINLFQSNLLLTPSLALNEICNPLILPHHANDTLIIIIF